MAESIKKALFIGDSDIDQQCVVCHKLIPAKTFHGMEIEGCTECSHYCSAHSPKGVYRALWSLYE